LDVMITFRIDRRSGTAVYAQLVSQVRQAVMTGRLLPGDRLPTAREVAERNGINPNTVLRAYRDLEVAELVEARQGSGTFVRQVLPRMPVDITVLRADLTEWVGRAHSAGLATSDIQTLVADVAADLEESHARARSHR
jgi:GntR family transcriptional regulator